MKELKEMQLEELWALFPIILRAHNAAYADWYAQEREALLLLLRDENVCRIHHIGSTAVKGLIAKPIVDILLELPENHDMAAVAARLEQNGWILMQKSETQKTMDFNKGYTIHGFAEKVFHLHSKPLGDWGELYFRDYLQNHPHTARQYEALKQSLLEQFAHNRDAYTEAKSAFILAHTEKARLLYKGRYLPHCDHA